MELDELKDRWQARTRTGNGNTKLEETVMTIHEQMLEIDSVIKGRNLYGTLTFVIVMLALSLFDYFLYLLESPVLVVGGVAVWLATIAVAAVRLHQVHDRSVNTVSDQPIADALQVKLIRVENEQHFYASITVTLFVPLGIGMVFVVLGVEPTMIEAISAFGSYLVCCYAGHAYNKKYIATKLAPIAQDLASCLEEIKRDVAQAD
ncbi:MAG: hypothetical protein QGI68_08825 [Pseudomonadales bacterium]|jgi:hypothetical protein|nr:hypothetical protein [Pseudomonadales bacterium]MDP7595658.1 hypothetical protein [Pseudomonadales bacterium]HJN51050.1 hypothetical protein [Pseudomonadales bacterium]|tara:strand:- start:3380 stop:3994 length:615 start_codon:yes stop_codon:yes gene_type:complete